MAQHSHYLEANYYKLLCLCNFYHRKQPKTTKPIPRKLPNASHYLEANYYKLLFVVQFSHRKSTKTTPNIYPNNCANKKVTIQKHENRPNLGVLSAFVFVLAAFLGSSSCGKMVIWQLFYFFGHPRDTQANDYGYFTLENGPTWPQQDAHQIIINS